MPIRFSQLREDITRGFKEPKRSDASKEAKRIGVRYLGFGRYGKEGKETHRVINGRLVPFKSKIVPKNLKISGKDVTSDSLKQPTNVPKVRTKPTPVAREVFKTVKKEGTAIHRELSKFYKQKNLDSDEENALKGYVGEGYQSISKYLKETSGGNKKVDRYSFKYTQNTNFDDVEEAIDHLDEILRSHKAPFSFTSYSGTRNLEMEEGGEYLLPLYTSMSTNIDVARGFVDYDGTESPTLLQFEVKKGQKGFYYGGPEQEFIIPRNAKIKVKTKKQMNMADFATGYYDPRHMNDKITVFVVEVVNDKDL